MAAKLVGVKHRRRLRFPLLCALVAVLVSACGQESTGFEVRPFAEIQEGPLVFENDPAVPDQGIFRVTTTEPMICSIAWGETEALGKLNNTLGMDGTGIIDHNVLLPDARPGQTYYFRVQGATADGTLYSTELDTFTLPERTGEDPAAALERLGENLATGASVTEVSSVFGDSFAAEHATDGDLSTAWSSAGDGDDAFIQLELPEERRVAEVAFLTREMADGSAVTESFTVTVDGETLGPFPAGTAADPSPAEVDVVGHSFRFEVAESTGGNTGAVEVMLLAGEPADG